MKRIVLLLVLVTGCPKPIELPLPHELEGFVQEEAHACLLELDNSASGAQDSVEGSGVPAFSRGFALWLEGEVILVPDKVHSGRFWGPVELFPPRGGFYAAECEDPEVSTPRVAGWGWIPER